MDRISGGILIRSIEMLLIVGLWNEYGSAHCLTQLWLLFARESEMARVGTVTSLVLIGRTATTAGLGTGSRVAAGARYSWTTYKAVAAGWKQSTGEVALTTDPAP